MSNLKDDTGLKLTIIIAALLVTGGLFYAGYKMNDNGGASFSDDKFTQKIEEGIEKYVKKQEEEAKKAQEEANKPIKVENVSVDDDAVLGNKNAPVTIVEFSDYECPFCKRSYEQVLPKLKEKYIDTGKVKLIFRDFPLDFHKNAIPAAMGAECAGDEGDEKYFAMHDKLFENQEAIGKEDIKKYAKEIGLNMTTFNECFDSEKHKEEIEKDMKEGAKYGVTGTPGYFINGWFIKGAYPFEEFEKYIEQELGNS